MLCSSQSIPKTLRKAPLLILIIELSVHLHAKRPDVHQSSPDSQTDDVTNWLQIQVPEISRESIEEAAQPALQTPKVMTVHQVSATDARHAAYNESHVTGAMLETFWEYPHPHDSYVKPHPPWSVLLQTAIFYALVFTLLIYGFRLPSWHEADKESESERLQPSDSNPPGGDGSLESVLSASVSPPTGTLLDWMHSTVGAEGEQLALASTDPRFGWTREQLHRVISDKTWACVADWGCVAVALPPGPELAITLLSLAARTKCAPLDPALSEAEVTATVRQVRAAAIILCPSAAPGAKAAADALGMPIFHFQEMPKQPSALQWDAQRSPIQLNPMLLQQSSIPTPQPFTSRFRWRIESKWNTAEDVALVLKTSGTTGNSKVVPLQLGQLGHGGKCIAASLDLCASDVCLNAMPLFHIGGISCNVLGPLVSGSAVICMNERFNAEVFLKHLAEQDPRPTWYYASPSIHLALLNAMSTDRTDFRLRLVRQGAAALPPALQRRMEGAFGCKIFATYSMTECMPVASPLWGEEIGERLQPLGSVGRAVGPDVIVRNTEVMIRGSLVTKGYEGPDSGWTPDGFFPTGDLGCIDAQGFLWLQGRRKEMINQGGETVIPQEIEDMIKGHEVEGYGLVSEVVTFAAPHTMLGEAVAIAVCLPKGESKLEATELRSIAESLAKRVTQGRQPRLVVFVGSVPRTHTGKVQRLALQRWLFPQHGPFALNGEEFRIVVVDARSYDTGKSNIQVLMDKQLKEARECVPSQVQAVYTDSLGIVRRGPQVAQHEVEVFKDMYLFGVIGIMCAHWRSYCPFIYNMSTFPVGTVLMALGGNEWHARVFPLVSGYQDASLGEEAARGFTRKDCVVFLFVLLMPWIWYARGLPPYSWIAFQNADPFIVDQDGFGGAPEIDKVMWWGPRIYFVSILYCRLFVIATHRLRCPRWVQLILALLFSAVLPQATRGLKEKVAQLCGDGTILALANLGVTLQNNDMVQRYVIDYMLSYYVAQPLFRHVAHKVSSAGLNTSDKRLLGLILWVTVAATNLIQAFQCMTTGYERQPFELLQKMIIVCWPGTKFEIINFKLSGILIWARVGLLASAVAFKQLSGVPAIAKQSFLAAYILNIFTVDMRPTYILASLPALTCVQGIVFALYFFAFFAICNVLQKAIDVLLGVSAKKKRLRN